MVRTFTVNGFFSPFVLSVDGMLGREALVVLTQFSHTMAAKMDEPVLHVQGQISGQIETVFARYYSLIICRALLPIPLRDREPDWDPESGWQVKSRARLTSCMKSINLPHHP